MTRKEPLPQGWMESNLAELADAAGGGTPSKADPSYWLDGTIPWVSPKDMKAFHLRSTEDLLTPKALDRVSLIPANSVLVVVRSGILSRTLPVALNAMPVTMNQDMRAFVPATGVSPRFIVWQLSAKERDVLDGCSKDGTTVASIEGPALARFPLLVAPQREQLRIVAKLEELLSDLDAGVTELKAAQKKLAQYRQSLLKAAVEGALTAEWRQRNRPTESGSQLLQRILSERRARWEARQFAKFKEQGKTPLKDWRNGYIEPIEAEAADVPKLPDGWVWASLGQLLGSLTSGSRDWAPYYDRGSCTFVMAQNVRPWRPDFSHRQLVDPPVGDRDRARSKIEKDDLLVTIVGANTGQSCRVHEHRDDHFVCQSVALLRPVLPALSEFLNAVLNSPGHGQRQFREMNYGAGRPHLSFDQIESVLVPLPPLEEQQQILDAIESSLNSVGGVEASIVQSLDQSNAQRQNILHAAFSGELVPQDPADEPASVLLERIRAERATKQGPPGKQRARKRKEVPA